jgi:hypothetical protein
MEVMDIYRACPALGREQPWFRVLHIEMKEVGESHEVDRISAKLQTYAMGDAPQYEALSYTWGGSDELLDIDINGQLFDVTPNLHKALGQLRMCETSGYGTRLSRALWVDAICINQKDDKEKSSQVMQMRDIYANASRTLIWLGPSDEYTGIAFDTLERFAVNDGTPDGSLTFCDLSDTMKKRRLAIQHFLERPYFSRVWVIQEVVVSRSALVCCGSFLVDWEKVNIGIQRLTGSGFYPFSTDIGKVTQIGIWREKFHETMDPLQRDEAIDLRMLIMDASDKHATDLRDKVYSLLGIASKGFAMGITVDYRKPTERVYIDCAKHLLRLRADLRILTIIKLWHRTKSNFCLPSWTPDWSQPQGPGGVLNRYYRFSPQHLFRAAGTNRSRVVVMEDSDMICLDGIRLDLVRSTVRIKDMLMEGGKKSISVTEPMLRKLAATILPSYKYPFTGEPSWEAIFRTFTADRTALSPRINDEYKARYFSTLTRLKLGSNEPDQNILEADWIQVSRFILPIVEGKDMFVTEQGYIGLAEEGFQVDDLVCIFFGGEVPFLVRRVDDNRFRLLAECYVHGVMDGEAMSNLEGQDVEHFWII